MYIRLSENKTPATKFKKTHAGPKKFTPGENYGLIVICEHSKLACC